MLSKQLDMLTLFTHKVTSRKHGSGQELKINVESLRDQSSIGITCGRLIDATGHNLVLSRVLPFSSARISNIPPSQLSFHLSNANAPFYVIGSGKTAMDTCKFIAEDPRNMRDCEVTLIGGRGTWFLNRDVLYPSHPGPLDFGSVPAVVTEMALYYRGADTDTQQLFLHLERKGFLHHVLTWTPQVCYSGILGEREVSVIRKVLGTRQIQGHAKDVIDRDQNTMLVTKRGSEYPVAEGACFVHCLNGFSPEPAPMISMNGLALNTGTLFFSSAASAWLLTPLFLRGELRRVADQFLALPALGNGEHVLFQTLMGIMYNFLRLAEAAPLHFMTAQRHNYDMSYFGFFQANLAMMMFMLKTRGTNWEDVIRTSLTRLQDVQTEA